VAKRQETLQTADGEEAAHEAGLLYVNDDEPGISRRRSGKGFRYVSPDGKMITDKHVLSRIKALAVPPAWSDVRICPSPRGHIQATGRDERGRKQYRYHPSWRQTRDQTKYDRMIPFGEALPAIRKRVREDLELPGLPREKVLATIVRVIDLTYIRVGNTRYAKDNKSFGMTTMRGRHADVTGSNIRFEFVGKGGKLVTVDVRDARVARIVKRCQEIPGQHLFQYLDDDGSRHTIDSDDVNGYLREISGQDFTAKDFRTWAGTVLALRALTAAESASSDAEARRIVNTAIEEVAGSLGNTVAVCRACYVHPAVVDAYLDGSLASVRPSRVRSNGTNAADRYRPHEAALLRFLRKASKNGPPAALRASVKPAKRKGARSAA
jgi:DNA topoisomerase-1